MICVFHELIKLINNEKINDHLINDYSSIDGLYYVSFFGCVLEV